MVIFIVHHAIVLPLSSGILNHGETCSLFLPMCLCAMNLLPAKNYVYSLTMKFSELEPLLRVFSIIESIILLAVPAIIAVEEFQCDRAAVYITVSFTALWFIRVV